MLSPFLIPVYQSLIASIIYGSSVALVDVIGKNRSFEKRYRKAFERAICQFYADPDMVGNEARRNYSEYLEMLRDASKQEDILATNNHVYEKLADLFAQEVSRDKWLHGYTVLKGVFTTEKKLGEIQKKIDELITEIRQNNQKNQQELQKISKKVESAGNELMRLNEKTGLSPIKIIDDAKDISGSLPELISSRKGLIEKIKEELLEKHVVLLYAGVKEGKTIASSLLLKQIEGCKLVWLDFGYENIINIDSVLSKHGHEEKTLFVLDAVRYEDERLYEHLVNSVLNEINDNWFFVISSYDKFSDHVYQDISRIGEIALPSFTLEEVKEMIPEDKQVLYATLIYSLFSGQPLLTNMACSYLKVNDWNVSGENLSRLFTFPKGTRLEKLVKKTFRRMVSDDESYHLLNRLLLFDKQFTYSDCEELALITPPIINFGKKLDELCGTWVVEDNGKYKVSDLLRKTVETDLLPQERKDCYELLAFKIIKQEGGLSPFDAARAFRLLVEAKNDALLTGFYISVLQKLHEQNAFDQDAAKIWKLIWIDVPLPVWMGAESKLMIRSTQLQLLVMSHHADSAYILDEIEKLLPTISDRSEIKSAVVKMLIAYHTLMGNTNKALDYQLGSRKLVSLPDFGEIDDDKVLLLSIDSVSTVDQLLDWGERYITMGEPEVELLADGVLIAINRICDKVGGEKIEKTLSELCKSATDKKMDLISSAACAKWIDVLQNSGKYEDADEVFKEFNSLTETKLGSILINYSYGLCLYHRDKSGENYIEKACQQVDLRLVSGVQMNAHCTLAQLKGDKGDYDGALKVVLQLSQNAEFINCYAEYERAYIYGSLGYAYWMAGDKENGLKNLLLVEKLLWEKHGEVDDNFKNLSIRFSITALYLNSTLEGNHTREDLLPADYGTFTKEFPWIKEEYNPLRNFTMMYPMYEMCERVLNDDETSIRMVEHMIAYQQTDAAEAGSMLSVMMLAYPICMETERFDLLEYIVLKSLSGSVGVVDERPINYENFVLLNAITVLVMKRTCMISEGVDFDDEWLFDFIKRSQNYLKEHQKSDELVRQMQLENPDFRSFTDAQCRYTASVYCVEKLPVEECMITLYTLCKILLSMNKMPSAIRLAEHFARCFAMEAVKANPSKYSIRPENMSGFLDKIKNRHGWDYLKGVLEGLQYIMNPKPIMSTELDALING